MTGSSDSERSNRVIHPHPLDSRLPPGFLLPQECGNDGWSRPAGWGEARWWPSLRGWAEPRGGATSIPRYVDLRAAFFHESRRATVRLNTGAPGLESSESALK